MLSNIKVFLASAIMSMTKLNQIKERESSLINNENDNVQEQKVKKQEINLISEQKFYDTLNYFDDYYKLKNTDKTANILKKRGIEKDFISFRNTIYEPTIYEQLNGNKTNNYKLQTDNDINKYTSDVHIKEIDGKLTLNFLINLQEHPIVRTIVESLKNLKVLLIKHNAKVYEYDVVDFVGVINPNPYEIFIVFEAICKINGKYHRELSNESKTINKKDLINPKNYKL